jgi:hypothetical protein
MLLTFTNAVIDNDTATFNNITYLYPASGFTMAYTGSNTSYIIL